MPDASPEGYVMHVSNTNKTLNIQVKHNFTSQNDTLALFVSQQGRPVTFGKVNFENAQIVSTIIPTQKLSGVIQVSLISTKGTTLCERLCYVLPPERLEIKAVSTDSGSVYKPFAPINYRISVKDKSDKPVRASLSVSVRDALLSDHQPFDNNIYTDLLLTSDLKGYIHQPGYYFIDRSPQRLRKLDALLLVRGWRKYDIGQALGMRAFTPMHLPETRLVLHGQIRSYVRLKNQSNMVVSVLAKRDSASIAGFTFSDSLGYFHIPVENFDGKMDALIQTRKEGSKRNKQTSISLSRNFSPPLRMYGYNELSPVYADIDSLKILATLSDSLFEDSIMRLDKSFLLEEVQVKAKKQRRINTQRFEQSISAYYDVPLLLDDMRDRGLRVESIATFLSEVNPKIVLNTFLIEQAPGAEAYEVSARYGSCLILYIINGALATIQERRTFLEKDLDAIQSLTLCKAKGALENFNFENSNVSPNDYWKLNEKYLEINWNHEKRDTARIKSMFDLEAKKALQRYGDGVDRISSSYICYINTIQNWKEEKNHGGSFGIRRTQIQGYSRPLEFYSPAYPSRELKTEKKQRRTLYWNPNLVTDENGEAAIHCYNAANSTLLLIDIETLCDDGSVCSQNSFATTSKALPYESKIP